MSSTFTRATVGFVLLTLALMLMAMIALWAIGNYANNNSWASLVVVIVALGAEISIYASTLHKPIHEWIQEPARERERQRNEAANIAADARRKADRGL